MINSPVEALWPEVEGVGSRFVAAGAAMAGVVADGCMLVTLELGVGTGVGTG